MAATAREYVFNCQKCPPSHFPGQGAEQTREDPAAHTKPIRNLSECQQECQQHPARAICGFVSGELLVVPAEWNKHTQMQRHSHTMGTGYPTASLTGCRDQKSQEKETGAGHRKDQELVRIIEE